MAYSAVSDLLTGDLQLPTYVDPQRFVNDAGDEIDSQIGFIYATPVNVNALLGVPTLRPIALLFKRINNFLASGRLLLATDVSGEGGRTHAYGMELIKEANLALAAIVTGKLQLQIPPADPNDVVVPSGPLQYNKDAESNVDAFYDRLTERPPFVTRTNDIPRFWLEWIFNER